MFFHREVKILIITGIVGSGKSYVIDSISDLLKNSFKVSTFFGIEAFNVAFNLITAYKNGPLKSSALSKLQNNLNGVQYLFNN